MGRAPGINIVGYPCAFSGMGTTARAFARALIDRGHEVALHDLDLADGRPARDRSLADRLVPELEALPHATTLWIVGGQVLPTMALRISRSARLQSGFNAGFVWWELPDLPGSFALAGTVFDALVTGSEFVREAWARAVPGVPVLLAQHPVDVPDGVAPDRTRFGLPPQAVVFYGGFDPASDPARKNPFAAVRAFQSASFAADGPPPRLLLKVNRAAGSDDPDDPAGALLGRLREMVEGDERIVLWQQQLDYRETLSLYASCDLTVSLHRAEGLGLMPLEAMRLGVPCIATGWSGNLDYMSHLSAALVRSAQVATDEHCALYAPSKIGVRSAWAEPDVAHAARWMGTLAADGALRRRMAGAARDEALAYDRRARALRFADELQALAAQPALRRRPDFASMESRLRQALLDDTLALSHPAARLARRAALSLKWRLARSA